MSHRHPSLRAAAGFAALWLAAICPAAGQVPATGWRLSAHAVQHSDALPLSRFGSQDFAPWLAARSERNLAYIQHEARLEYQTAALGRFALLTRQSATLTASRGAIELAADIETSGRPPGDRQWAVRGRYFGFAGDGLAWQQTFDPAPGWQLQAGVQALLLNRWRERRIDGDASYRSAADSYRFDLLSFQAEERLVLPYQQDVAQHGQALMFDGELRWTGADFAARLGWRDAGWLRWKGLPQNRSKLSSDTRTIDGDGFVVYKPLLEGQNEQTTRSLSAPLRLSAFAGWRPGPATELEVGFEWLRHFGVLPVLRGEQTVGDWRWGLAWHSHERRLSASAAWRGVQLRVGADRLKSAARSRELALSGHWAL